MLRRLLGNGAAGFASAALCALQMDVSGGAESVNGSGPGDESVSWTDVTPVGKGAGFVLKPEACLGPPFTNVLSPQVAAANQIRLNGSGVTLGDFDNDGWCDLYLSGLESDNRLYRNLGNWKFEDVTQAAGVACSAQFSTGAVFADVDGDDDLDLLVNSIGGGTRCFFNQGDARFEESNSSGLSRRLGSTSMALADIEGDGDLDLYVANYRTTTIRSTGVAILNVNGRRMIHPKDRDQYELTPDGLILEHGEIDAVYRNDGGGRFSLMRWEGGIFLDEQGKPLTQAPRDWGLSVAFRDLNLDGAPDLYVCNDFHTPDRIWLNNGRGLLRAIETTAIRHTCTFSMTVDFADINRDGWDDFLAADMLDLDHARRMRQAVPTDLYRSEIGANQHQLQVERNVLQLNRGDGTFADVAYYAGLEASGWTWSLAFLDVDLDGWEDVLAATGTLFDTQDLDAFARIQAMGPVPRDQIPKKLLLHPPLRLPNLAFRNDGNLRFHERGTTWGFDADGVSHGMALGDLDRDGDLDVVVNSLNSPVLIYENQSPAPRVAVRLKGRAPNTRGIGARIRLLNGPVPEQSQEMMCGGRYLSGDDSVRVFAVGAASQPMRLEVSWRSGLRTLVDNVQANRIYEISEADTRRDSPRSRPQRAGNSEWFRPTPLPHVHHENLFNDFERQPLLPRRFSQLGPALAWADLDQDGQDELIVGNGQGGELAVLTRKKDGEWRRMELRTPEIIQGRELSGIVSRERADGRTDLLVGLANYEEPQAPSRVVEYDLSTGHVQLIHESHSCSVGPLALADLDGDGDLDLFVGGRIIGGRYPEAASSEIYRYEHDQWVRDESAARMLQEVGLVSGAVWTDLTGDGLPELVLALEWGPLRVFTSSENQWKELTASLGLDEYAGWWAGIAAGDFNGDGKMDLAASNWGLNTRYRASTNAPLRLFYGELGGNRPVDLLEAWYDPTRSAWLPQHDLFWVSSGLPGVPERFSDHRAYGMAAVEEILGSHFESARTFEATVLGSSVFLNQGGRFHRLPLPAEAQFAPAFGIVVADFDGDAIEDLFLAQNFFPTAPRDFRHDAGRGLCLRGLGDGRFAPVPGQLSGIRVYGEGRAAAASDVDRDGRTDLAVAQNGAQTLFFQNTHARPGVRIRLRGPAGNSTASGAIVRLRSAGGYGPAREWHQGTGYWSQDSATQVLYAPGKADEVAVRWPGGTESVHELPPDTRAVDISIDGSMKVTAADGE